MSRTAARPPLRALAVLLLAIVACTARGPAVPDELPPETADTIAPPSEALPDTVVDSLLRELAELRDKLNAPPPIPDTVTVLVRDVRVCAGGDVMLGNNLDTLWAARASARLGRRIVPLPDPEQLLAPLRPLVSDADILLLNIEGAIGDGPAPSKCRPGSTSCYAFRQPVDAATALARLLRHGVVVGNVANNHAMDAGAVGFQGTLRNLGLAGVHGTGADTLATVVETAHGDTVAFLGFSTAQAGPDPRDLDGVRRHVSRAAAQHARLVVTMHMGAEGRDAQRTPDSLEYYVGENRGNAVRFARSAVDAGASVVIGHGPHVMRAAEWYRGALILYSLGNLLTYGTFNLSEPMNRGAIACVSLDAEGRVTAARLRPTRQVAPGVVAPDPTGRAGALIDSLSQLDFPRSMSDQFPEVVLTPPAAVRPDDR